MREDKSCTVLVAEITAAYVSRNEVALADLPDLIAAIHGSLASLSLSHPARTQPQYPTTMPAVPIDQSVTNDYIVCLEDGKRFKSLKRHLRTGYGLTPEEYRKKWGLPAGYPMVAPHYARRRSALARLSGFGKKVAR